MTDKCELRHATFKDILINEAGNDIVIPISATFDKAVLHIGIGNRSGVTIEKPALRQGKQLKTSVGHATRDMMERYFPGEMDELQEIHRRDRIMRNYVPQDAVAKQIKDATKKECQLVHNIKVYSKGDTKELENAVKDEVDIKIPLTYHSEAGKGTSLDLADKVTSKIGLHAYNKAMFADDPNNIQRLMAAAKELSEEALRDALSEMSTARRLNQITVKDDVNILDNSVNVAKEMSVTVVDEAKNELKMKMPSLGLPQVDIKKLYNANKKLDKVNDDIMHINHLIEKAKAMSRIAVNEAMKEIKMEMPQFVLPQMYIRKLANAHKKMDSAQQGMSSSCQNLPGGLLIDTAKQMSITALDEAKTELKLELPPLALPQMYIKKLAIAHRKVDQEDEWKNTQHTFGDSSNGCGASSLNAVNKSIHKSIGNSTELSSSLREHVGTEEEPNSKRLYRSRSETGSIVSQSNVDQQRSINNFDNTVEVHPTESECTSSDIDIVEVPAAVPETIQGRDSIQPGTSNSDAVPNLFTRDRDDIDEICNNVDEICNDVDEICNDVDEICNGDDAFGIMKIFLSSDIHSVLNVAIDADMKTSSSKKDFGYTYFSLSNFIKY